MVERHVISEAELPRRDGVDLVEVAGIGGTSWPVPAALWHAPRGFDTRARPDRQPCHIIAVRLSGGTVQRIGARPERLRPNGFSVHPACSDLRFLAPTEIRFAHLYVSDAFLRSVSGAVSAASGEARLVRDDRVMYEDPTLSEEIERYVSRAFDRRNPPSPLEMESRANLIAIQFLQRHALGQADATARRSRGQLAPWQVRRVCAHMEGNLGRAVGLTELSDMVGISPEHFCRAFRRSVGVPPQRWLLAKRMEAARRLLQETDASLTAIAQELGYAGQSAFGAAFRSLEGLSPGQYRRSEGGPAGEARRTRPGGAHDLVEAARP